MKNTPTNVSGRFLVMPDAKSACVSESSGQIPARASISPSHALPPFRAEMFGRYSLLVLVLAVGLTFFNMIRFFLVPVILAAVLAALFYPLHHWILKVTRGRNALSALLSCIVLSLGILLPVYGIASIVGKEAVRLYQKAESGVQGTFPTNLDQIIRRNPVLQKVGLDKLPVQASLEELGKKTAGLIAIAIKRISRETFELISTVLITFFTLFYFFRDGPVLLRRLKELSPLSTRYEDELIRRFLSVSRATFRGILLVAVIKGVLGGLTFRAFGIEAAVLWGVVMIFFSIVPMVGIWVVMCPAALIMLLNGDLWQGALMLGAALVVGSVDNILEPFLIGRGSGMHDLLVFFSMLGGLAAFGVTGFIVGPVIAALFVALLDIYGLEFSKQLQALHDPPADPHQSRATSASP